MSRLPRERRGRSAAGAAVPQGLWIPERGLPQLSQAVERSGVAGDAGTLANGDRACPIDGRGDGAGNGSGDGRGQSDRGSNRSSYSGGDGCPHAGFIGGRAAQPASRSCREDRLPGLPLDRRDGLAETAGQSRFI